MSNGAVLIPIKSFLSSKSRLGTVLEQPARASLVRKMAAQVLGAANLLPTYVVTGDDEVKNWAKLKGADVIEDQGLGLNAAVCTGVDHLASLGYAWVTICHSDLPNAANLAHLFGFDGVTLVPDLAEEGTNVMVLPTSTGFQFFYGKGSFLRHQGECHRLKLDVRVVRTPTLGFDIDRPEDLLALRAQVRRPKGPRTASVP